MKKILFLVAICLIMLGCKKKHTEPYGYVWYETKSNGLYGAEDEVGNMLLPCRYKSIALDTFQTRLNDFNRKVPTYDSFWMWNVKDKNGNNLKIKTWQNNYGQTDKHSFIQSENSNNELVDENFDVIYKGVFHYGGWSGCSLNSSAWVWNSGGDISDKVFYRLDVESNEMIINKQGKVIIPGERQYYTIEPIQICNKSFYLAMIEYESYEIFVVVDNKGQELFRLRNKYIKNTWYMVDYGYDKNNKTYKNYDVITWAGEPMLLYDDKKGFGVFEEKDDDYIISWTGIKLPDYCTSFDVEPSNNNKKAKVLDLYEIARQYRKGESVPSINIYPSPIVSPTSPMPTPSSGIETTPTKHWITVTREVDCQHCWHSGKCETCNGNGCLFLNLVDSF